MQEVRMKCETRDFKTDQEREREEQVREREIVTQRVTCVCYCDMDRHTT